MKQLIAGITLMVVAYPAIVAAETDLWNQIGFTATEVLIYADQLQKLDQTVCNHSPVAAYSTQQTRQKLLAAVPKEDEDRLTALLDSPMVTKLLQENSAGIQSMLGSPQLAAGPLTEEMRALCLELSLVFNENQRQAQEDFDRLLKAYRGQ